MLIAVALGVLLYVHFRAAVLALTYDECWSFMGYARSPLKEIVLNTYPAANNHILNTLLIKLSGFAFGSSEYAIRLPVLLAHTAYIFVTWLLLKRFFPRILLPAFILLNLQPYLLDYFVAARGYGLAIFFLVLSIYFIFSYQEKPRFKYLFIASFSICLAAYSNFTYILLIITIVSIAFLLMLEHKMLSLKSFLALFIPPLCFIPLLFIPVKQLVKAGELYYGGQTGFWEDTVMTLSRSFLYHSLNNSLVEKLLPVLFLAFVLTGLTLLYNKSKQNNWRADKNWILLLLLLLPAAGSTLQHYIFDKPYLIDRTALFFIPVSLLLVISVLNELEANNTNGILIKVKYFLAILAVVLFVKSFNFHSLVDFKEHADTRQMLTDLTRLKEADENDIILGKSVYMNATINYYIFKMDLDWIRDTELTFCSDEGERPYYYLFKNDIDCVDTLGVEQLKYYPVSKTYLFKNQIFNNSI